MSDIEVARWIAEYPREVIPYNEFDERIGITNFPESQDKNLARWKAVSRVNTLLRKGIVIQNEVKAFEILVEKRTLTFRRTPLEESANIAIDNMSRRVGMLVDSANKKASWALNLDKYRDFHGEVHFFRNSAPLIPDNPEAQALRIAQRQLNHDVVVMRAIVDNVKSSLAEVEALSNSNRARHRSTKNKMSAKALPKQSGLMLTKDSDTDSSHSGVSA